MTSPLVTYQLNKTFGAHQALGALTLEIPFGRVVGLIGRNGSGKTTLLNLACGLLLPTLGTCSTLGRPSGELAAPELSVLGIVAQAGQFINWMTVAQQLQFHASFYKNWDQPREQRLLDELDLNPARKIDELSPGDLQKLGIILGVCHHPKLLLLDEPMSALDPIARQSLLKFLLDLVREDEGTIIISSHLLSDVEKIIDWVVCLDRGELAVSAPYDELQERYAEWIVTPASGSELPRKFAEPWVLAREGDSRRARLQVRLPSSETIAQFSAQHSANVIDSRPLNLEQLFPLLINERSLAQ